MQLAEFSRGISTFGAIFSFAGVASLYLGEFDTHSAVCECSHSTHVSCDTAIHEGGLGFHLNQIRISLSVIGVLLQLPLALFIFLVVSTQSIHFNLVLYCN